jgi:hypothetical protein
MRFHNLPENERDLSPAPLLSNQYGGPLSPADSVRIPKLRISGTDQTIGGDFSRSSQLTTVISFVSSIDFRRIYLLCKLSVHQSNLFGEKLILSSPDS